MTFSISTSKRTLLIEANTAPGARAIAERQLADGETIRHICLDKYAFIDPSPVMSSDHARNVAEARRGA